MSTEPTLAELLTEFMESAEMSEAALENLIKERFDEDFWVGSKTTIRRWKTGETKTVRHWQQLLGVAAGLFLGKEETEALLRSAGHRSLSELLGVANEKERKFLSRWTDPAPHREIIGHEIVDRLDRLESRVGSALGRVGSATTLRLPDPSEDVPGIRPLPSSSRMTLGPNPLFSGREKELRALLQLFQRLRIAAIVGLGGVGKTQLAVEFAHRYGRFFQGGVFFLSCGDPSNIEGEIAACGGLDGLDLHFNYEKRPLSEQVRLVKSAWREPIPRLLIFDNLDDHYLLQELIPPTGGCRILITTRRSTWPIALGIGQLELEPLPRSDSVDFLQRIVPDLDLETADQIAGLLGDLPLALHVAAHYMATYRRSIPPATYLSQVNDVSLLQHESLRYRRDVFSPTAHELHVSRTFAISYNKLDVDDPVDALALKILQSVVNLAPGEPVPVDLVQAVVADALPAENRERAIEDSLTQLTKVGLVKDDGEAIHVHRLVTAFVREQPHGAVGIEGAVQTELKRLNRERSVKSLRAWLPHLKHVVRLAQQRADARAAKTNFCFGLFLLWRANLNESLAYLHWALEVQEKLLGEMHIDTAATLQVLGMAHSKLYELETARSYYERALAIRQELLGPNDRKTIYVMNNIGVLYLRLGDLAKAKAMLEEVHELKLKSFGANTCNVN